ncbi:MAG: hypothetical protein DDG58_12200 [Ardenticatenia bacterium]|jgi:hypothetical protein|nr:MAG: hypothetical protein DDG58_12200 [Ardenticatenia bacterium]
MPPGPVSTLTLLSQAELLVALGPLGDAETNPIWQLYRGYGDSWQRLAWPDGIAPYAFHVPPAGDPIFAVPLSNALLGSGQPWGLLRSTDAGQSWQQVLKGLGDPYVMDVALSPRFPEDRTAVAVTWRHGVYLSHNGGDSWQPLSYPRPIDASGGANPYDLAIALSPDFHGGTARRPVTQGQVVASYAHGLHIWSATTSQWQTVSITVPSRLEDHDPPSAPLTAGAIAFSPDFAQDSTLYLYSGYAGLFRSNDGGNTWQFVGRELPAPVPPTRAFHLEVVSANVACVLLATPSEETEAPAFPSLHNRQQLLYCTHDGGTSWHTLQPPPEVGTVSAFTMRRNTDGTIVLYLGSTQGGVFEYSVEALSWQ